MKRLLFSSRYLIYIAVITAIVGAFAIVLDAALTTINLILNIFHELEFTVQTTKVLSIDFIEVIDLLFVGIVFYIFALGLYRLFIDSTIRLPPWLKLEDFEQLKIILMSVVVVILVINFTGAVVKWDGEDIMQVGIGIALVIAAIGLIFYLRIVSRSHEVAPLDPSHEKTND